MTAIEKLEQFLDKHKLRIKHYESFLLVTNLDGSWNEIIYNDNYGNYDDYFDQTKIFDDKFYEYALGVLERLVESKKGFWDPLIPERYSMKEYLKWKTGMREEN